MVNLVKAHPVYIAILYAISFIIAVHSLVRLWALPHPSNIHKKRLFNRDVRDGQVLNFLAGCLELMLPHTISQQLLTEKLLSPIDMWST
jgi:hypothetical protein